MPDFCILDTESCYVVQGGQLMIFLPRPFSASIPVQAASTAASYLTLSGWVTGFMFRHLTLHL